MVEKGWSIRYEDWESLDQAMQTATLWKSALLTSNDQSLIPERPGVYAICARPPNVVGPGPITMFHSLASPSMLADRSLASGRDSSTTAKARIHSYEKQSIAMGGSYGSGSLKCPLVL